MRFRGRGGRRNGAPPLLGRLGASPVVASTLLLLTSPLLIAWLSARPQLVDYVAVLALTLLMRRLVQDRASAWSLLAIGILTIVWVNLHAGALLGVAIVGAITVMVFAGRSTRDRSGWCLAALITAAASSLINPYGIDLITQTLRVKGASTGIIDEWQHIDPADPTQMIMIVLGLVALVVAARRGDAAFAGALGVAVIGSVTAIRLLPILLLLALPVLAAFASHRSVLGYLHSRRVVLGPGAAVGVVALLVLSLPSLGHLGRPDPGDLSDERCPRDPAKLQTVQLLPAGRLCAVRAPRRASLTGFAKRSLWCEACRGTGTGAAR